MYVKDYDTQSPIQAVVESSEPLTPSQSSEEIRHIVLKLPPNSIQYIEGQSIGVLAPTNLEFGNPVHFRLYTVANSREGEKNDPDLLSICVKKCNYIDDFSGEEMQGVASHYLCNLRKGETVSITGPYEQGFSYPEDTTADLIMISVGTGIAPFRSFVTHIHNRVKHWEGKVRLYYGARTGLEHLYLNNLADDRVLYYTNDTFEAFGSLFDSGREGTFESMYNEKVGNMTDALKANVHDVAELIVGPKTHVYVAGPEKIRANLDNTMVKFSALREKYAIRKSALLKQGRWQEIIY